MLWPSQAHAAPSNYMPVEGSTIAGYVDSLYGFLLTASFISFVLVIGGLIYFAIRYKRQPGSEKSAYITHNNVLEFLWSFIPFVIFLVVFGWGWWVFDKMHTHPENALEVHVVGQKWSWDFLYKSGKRVTNEFMVPVDTPVKLIMTSQDVIHSFFVPAFRIKQDVVPGMYTALSFVASKKGSFQVFCTEYCGDGHSAMLAKLNVVSQEEYESWLAQGDPYEGLTLVEVGQKQFQQKCAVCHTAGTEKKIGPGLANVFGQQRNFENGESLVGDENYIRESILNPNQKIVQGYPAAMPPFQGQLTEQELSGLVEYIKSLAQ